MDRQELERRSDAVVAAWNDHDAEGVVRYTARDAIFHDMTMPEPLQGRDEIREATQAYFDAFSDLRITIDRRHVDGNVVIDEWISTGTHDGELMGMAATGRTVTCHGCVVTTFDEHGRQIHGAQYWNGLELLEQIGAVTEREAAHA